MGEVDYTLYTVKRDERTDRRTDGHTDRQTDGRTEANLNSGKGRLAETNTIYHRSQMQTEKSQPEGKRIIPETMFTEFEALSVDPRVGISRSASETDD